MSIIVSLDPNVVLSAAFGDSHCRSVLIDLIDRSPEFVLGVDPQMDLIEAFNEQLDDRAWGHDLVRLFSELYLNRDARGRRLILKYATLSATERKWLKEHGCGEPIEPALVAVGKAAPHPSCLVVLGKSSDVPGIRPRGCDSPTCVEQLEGRWHGLEVWPSEYFGRLLAPMPQMRFPATEEQLRVLLEQGEHECLEFKQPGTEDNQVGTVLTKEIRRAALEAATAMLNDMGGKVIIGISPQGEILGVELPAGKYAGLARADALYKWLVDNLSCVRPKPAKFVKPVVVPLQNGRHVIIVHVLRDPQGRPYTYNHESVDRLGSTTQAAEA